MKETFVLTTQILDKIKFIEVSKMYMLLFLFLFSCGNYLKNEYINTLNEKVPGELIKYFPDNIETEDPFTFYYEIDPVNDKYKSIPYSLYLEYIPSNFEFVKKEIKENALATYSSDDTCNFVLLRFQKDDWYRSQSDILWKYENWYLDNYDCLLNRYPMPNFIGPGENEFERKIGLDPSYQYFILEAEKGKKFGEEFYFKEPLEIPLDWSRGYSNGVAISEKLGTVIYWIVIW